MFLPCIIHIFCGGKVIQFNMISTQENSTTYMYSRHREMLKEHSPYAMHILTFSYSYLYLHIRKVLTHFFPGGKSFFIESETFLPVKKDKMSNSFTVAEKKIHIF